MNRVYIKTYGCQMNERDSEAVAAQLRARGYTIVADEHGADVVLLNTCAVRDQAEQKAIGKSDYLARRKAGEPNFVLGVMGCMAQNRGRDLLERLPDLDLLVGTQKFHRVPDHLDAMLESIRGQGPRPSTIVDLEAEAGSQNTIREHREGRQVTAYVSIMQGCDMHCTFCIVPKTRGPERCRPPEDIVGEVRGLVAAGTREVTLLGQIVTSYGRRELPFRNGKSPFVQLIEALHGIDGLERIRFTSPHPRGFKDDLVQAYRDLPKLCPSCHLPLQSGSDRILRAMHRPYSAQRFLRIVGALREAVPDITVSTDVIVGFPGETDEDFAATRAVFEQVEFDMAFVFKYSVRTGTAAAELPDAVPVAVKDVRNQELLQLLETSSLRRNAGMIGTVQEVLVEGPARRGEGMLSGRTPHHRKVIFPGPLGWVGELVPVRIQRATVAATEGRPLQAGLAEDEGARLAGRVWEGVVA